MTPQRKYLIVLSIFLTSLFSINEAHSQSSSVDAALTKALTTDELLPFLIESAVRNSAQVKRLDNNISLAEADLARNKNALYSGITLLSTYRYGTNYSAINDETVFNDGVYRLTSIQQGYYNVGIGLQFPIINLFNRKHIIKLGQSQIGMISNEKEYISLNVKQEVIRLYQEMKLYQRLLTISSSNKQSFQVNYTLSEKEFLQGNLTVEEISRILDFLNKSKIEYETNLNKFQTSIMQLEAFTGVTLASLLKRVK